MKNERGFYHYPNLTDVQALRSAAIKTSKTEPVTLHFHPYSDIGCKQGEKQRDDNTYEGLPIHERYVDGEIQ